MIRHTYEDPDTQRRSTHDGEREIRTPLFGEEGIEVSVDTVDGPVVTVWGRGPKP